MDLYTSQIIQQVFLTRIQPKQDIAMSKKVDNISDHFWPYEDEKSIPEAQNIKRDHKDLVGESSNTGSHAKAGRTSQDGLLGSESLLSLRKLRFSEQEFSLGTPVSNIKYKISRSKFRYFFLKNHVITGFAIMRTIVSIFAIVKIIFDYDSCFYSKYKLWMYSVQQGTSFKQST